MSKWLLLAVSMGAMACQPSLSAAAWEQPAGPGEAVTYSLSYLGFTVGRGEVRVSSMENSPDRWNITTRGAVNIVRVYSAGADVTDDWSPTLGSAVSEQVITENGKQRRETVRFDPGVPLARVRREATGSDPTETEVELTPVANNVASTAFAALRVAPLAEGESRAINLFTGKEVKPLVATHVGKRSLNTAFGVIDVVEISIEGQLSSAAELKAPMKLFLTDDVTRLPVRLEAQVGLGSLVLDAVDYRFEATP